MLSATLLTTATWCWLHLAGCEWVEISQHHYRPRKPYGNDSIREYTWNQPNRRIDIKHIDYPVSNSRFSDVTAPVNFKNYENKTWSQSPNKRIDVKTVDSSRLFDVTTVVNSKMQDTRTSEVTPAIYFNDFGDRRVIEVPNIHVQEIDTNSDYPRHSTRPYDFTPTVNFKPGFTDQATTEIPKLHVKGTGLIHGKIEKVPNVGSVKRVQLSNTPIKSPSIKVHNAPNRKFKNESNSNSASNAPFSSEFSDEFDIKSDIFQDSYEEVVSISPSSHNQNNLKINPNMVTEVSNGNNPSYPNFDENVTRKPTPEINSSRVIKIESNDQINSSDPSVGKVTNKILKDTPQITNSNKISEQVNVKDGKKEGTISTNYKYPDDDSGTEKTNEYKLTTMENLVKFMKVVTDTISKNTRRGVNGKVKYLNDLNESLMQNIKSRIDACWPDDSMRRRSRSATSRGHVEFPSSESALMTISFLTFAVFLIKLVLQVIQTYKNKAMIMAPVMVATAGRAFAGKQDKY